MFLLYTFLNLIIVNISYLFLISRDDSFLFQNNNFIFINIVFFGSFVFFLFIILIILKLFQTDKTKNKVDKDLKRISLLFLIIFSIGGIWFSYLSINNKYLTNSYEVSKNEFVYISWYEKNLFLNKKDIEKVVKHVNSKINNENKKLWGFYINIKGEKEEIKEMFEKDKLFWEDSRAFTFVGGYYNRLTDTINIYPIQSFFWFWKENQKIVIAHEIWHWFWNNKLKEKEQEEWKELFKKSFYEKNNKERFIFWLDENFLTEYSKSSYAEDFAEFFSIYINEKTFIDKKVEYLKKTNKESLILQKQDFIKKVLN